MTSAAPTSETGAERYFAQQHEDAEFHAAYMQARDEIDFVDALVSQFEERRQELGLSEADLARRAGLRERRVRGLLSLRRRDIRLDTLAAVAAVTGVELRFGVSAERTAPAVS